MSIVLLVRGGPNLDDPGGGSSSAFTGCSFLLLNSTLLNNYGNNHHTLTSSLDSALPLRQHFAPTQDLYKVLPLSATFLLRRIAPGGLFLNARNNFHAACESLTAPFLFINSPSRRQFCGVLNFFF